MDYKIQDLLGMLYIDIFDNKKAILCLDKSIVL